MQQLPTTNGETAKSTRGYNRYFLLTDIILLALAAYLSFVLRLESFALTGYGPALGTFLVFALLLTPLVFYATGIYRRYWPYASLDELLLLAGSVALATVLISLGVFLAVFTPLPAIPRSIPFIFFLLALAASAGPRLAARLYARQRQRRNARPLPRARRLAPHDTLLRTVVMGAGNSGAMIVRELRQHPRPGIDLIGFLDDDPAKHGLDIHGLRVLGDRHLLPELVASQGLQQVIIAMPSAPGKAVRELLQLCERHGLHTRVIPGLSELVDGQVSFNQVRDIQIEDLLRRAPVRTDTTALRDLLQGKRVLVTGGGGSIGSELCRQVLRFQPAAMIIVGHGENSVFEIYNELQHMQARQAEQARERGEPAPPVCRLHPVIADIRFPNRIQRVFEEYEPQIVFHAAAHKHVPLMEHSPAEAIMNNLLGTRNLLNAAQAAQAEHFVMISTDKAVNPTSIMGASKRAAELLVHQAALNTGRPYVAVRFGNVLGSRGSVVLTFKKQIAAGGPVTVTHPEMRRYFMTIPEAVQLVLHAAVLGTGGEVFTLDMGEQIKISDLARDMIELSGLEVGRDIDIMYTGMRPGEKLYEELFMPDEVFHRTAHEKIFIAANASSFVPQHLHHWIESLAIAADRNDTEAILLVLQRLLPQHQLKQAFTMMDGPPLARELLAEEEPQASQIAADTTQTNQTTLVTHTNETSLLVHSIGENQNHKGRTRDANNTAKSDS